MGQKLCIFPGAESVTLNPRKLKTNASNYQWDDALEEVAQNYANILAGKGGGLKHDPHDSNHHNQGENIWWDATNISESELYLRAIYYWSREGARYKGEVIALEDLEKWGHYTQVRSISPNSSIPSSKH